MFTLQNGSGILVESGFSSHSDDPCSNPADVYIFSVKMLKKEWK